MPPHDLATSIDEKTRRYAGNREFVTDGFGRIAQDGEGQSEVAHELIDGAIRAAVVDTYTDNTQSLRRETLMKLLQFGQFFATRNAPGSPYVQQHDVATQFSQ